MATILPFGGDNSYKGFALALAMQALGVLAGSGLGDDKTYGYLIMAIDPERHLREGIVIDRKIYEALLAVPPGKLPGI